VRRFHHVNITVADLNAATAFFVRLGLEVEGRMFMEGEFGDAVIGIPDSPSEIVMLRRPTEAPAWKCRASSSPTTNPGRPPGCPPN
jgi:catechol 2,3-dioxygenase-like lactoylglutathione lyase family enzyme